MKQQTNTFATAAPKAPLQLISVTYLGRQILVPTEDIICLEGDGNYTFLYTRTGRRYLLSKTLRHYADHLDNQVFVRIHKSYVINVYYLQDFDGQCGRTFTLTGGKEVTVSRRRYKEIIEQIAQHQVMALA